METALKKRLVGAAILVALIVIVVPEFLRGKPPQGSGATVLPRAAESAGAGPDASATLRSVTVDMREPVAAPPNQEPTVAATTPAAAPASASTATSLPAAPAGAAAPTREPAAPASRAPAAQSTPAPAARTAASNLPKPQADGPWVVQLGSFALKVSAERLVRELKAAGYPAYVSPVKRGARELFRVRVGPMADRPAASAYYAALRAAGKDAAIVANR